MDIRKAIEDNKVKEKEYTKDYLDWLNGKEIKHEAYEFILDKMQECINNEDGDFKKFYFYGQAKTKDFMYSKREEMKIFIDEMFFIQKIVNINKALEKYNYPNLLPTGKDIANEFVEAIYFLYDQYINNDDNLSRYLNDLESVEKDFLKLKSGECEQFKGNSFEDFIGFSCGDNTYILYLLLERELKKNPVVDSRKLKKYIIGNDLICSYVGDLEKRYGIYSDFRYNKEGYISNEFLGLDFILFSKSKEELEKEKLHIKKIDKEYLEISEKVFNPILEQLNEILLKYKNTFSEITKEILEKVYIELSLRNPDWKYRNVKHFFDHYHLYIIIDSLFCKFTYHYGKDYYLNIKCSYLDSNNNEFWIKHEEEEKTIEIPLIKANRKEKSVYGNAILGGIVGGQAGATIAAMKTIAENEKTEIYNKTPVETITRKSKIVSYEFCFYTGNYDKSYGLYFNFDKEIQNILHLYKYLRNSRMSLEEYRENEKRTIMIIKNNINDDYNKLLEQKDILDKKLSKMKFTLSRESRKQKSLIIKNINNIDIQLKYLNKYMQEHLQ